MASINQVHIIDPDKVQTTSSVVYKIRRKADGLYSSGGVRPVFEPDGKEFSSLRILANHLRVPRGGGEVRRISYGSPYGVTYLDEVEIVTVQKIVTRAEIGVRQVQEYADEITTKPKSKPKQVADVVEYLGLL